MSSSPQEIYESHIAILEIELKKYNKWYGHLSSMRVTSFFTALVIGSFNQYQNWFSAWWLSSFIVLFVILVLLHELVVSKQKSTQYKVDFFSKGLDRIKGEWHKNQTDHKLELVKDHLFAHDLEIFGKDSLFNLLCTAFTQSGKQQLQKWLSNTPSKKLIEERQIAVQELSGQVDFRLSLNVEAAGLEHTIHPERLTRWAKSPAYFTKSQLFTFQIIAWALSASMLLGLVLWGYYNQPPIVFFSVLLIELGFYSFINKKLAPLFAEMGSPNKELNFISSLLKILEMKNFSSEFLNNLQNDLKNSSGVASKEIFKFDKLIQKLDMRRNQLFAVVAYLFMWSVHFGLRIERWRLDHGQDIPHWLETVGEFEAVNSIANYAFEHPQDNYPTLKDGPAFFHGEELGHPLIADSDCIRNSIELNQNCGLWIISGSNMCGKSTFLRVIGINLVMSYLGAPIRGKSLSLSPLTLGSSINVQDSLEKGHSKFYAEILQVKRLVEAAKSKPPVLFLMDELLHGTNSHDRLLGAKSIITHMLKHGGIGLITTHDLTLTKAIDELNLSAKNMHFQDQFEGDKLRFDYKVHSGVVAKSNALELMRSIGIDV
jgi:hypothetical protein